MSTSTASSSIPSFYSMDGVTRLNGTEFASGLDTQNLIKALTSKTSEEIDRTKQLEQKTEWKRDMFRDIEDMLQKFSDNYFSYSSTSGNNILSGTFFDSDNLTSSNSSAVTATGPSKDAGNIVINSISNLATKASLSTKDKVSNEAIESLSEVGKTISSSSYLDLKLDNKSYRITLGSDIDVSKLSVDTPSSIAAQLATQLQNQINSNSDLRNKVTVSALNDTLKLNGATITGASQNFIGGLGLTGSNASYSLSGSSAIDSQKLYDLGNKLAGVTLTFKLDGLQKNITFDQSSSSSYNSVSGLQSYLQTKLTSAFGSGKVTVSLTSDNKLSFKTSDGTSVLELDSASASGILGKDGVLHIESGETNRLEMTKTLGELNTKLNTDSPNVALSPEKDEHGNPVKNSNGKNVYKISVNNASFEFNEDTELGTVINTINNNSEADVNISYSQTLDKFIVTSKDTGTQETINIQDVGTCNLASSLFGTGGTVTAGKDLKMNVTINGTATDIARTTNSFTLDGLNLNVLNTFNSGTTPDANEKITFTSSNGTDDVYKKISDFIADYNSLIDKVNTYVTQTPYGLSNSSGKTQTYNPLTDDQKKDMSDTEIKEWNEKAKQGLLFSDPQLTSLQNDLRSAMEHNVEASGLSLSAIGISTSSNYMSGGKLAITDANKLKNALQNNTDQVIKMFTNVDDSDSSQDGIAPRVKSVLNNYFGTYGNSGILYYVAGSNTTIGSDKSELTTQISQYETQIKDLQSQLTTQRNNLQTKFTTMEQAIYRLSNQYNYLSGMSS